MSRFVYGMNPVLEALKAHPQDVVRVVLERGRDGRRSHGGDRVAEAASAAGVRIEEAPHGELARRSRGGVHQGVGAEMAGFRYAELPDLLAAARSRAEPPFLLLLDGVTDPQNLGALVRSAHALGAHGVVLPKDRAAGITPAASKAAAGALEHCPVARVTNLSRAIDDLKEGRVWSIALAADGDRDLSEVDLSGAIALVLGSEGKGVRPLVRKTCDLVARIPMRGRVGSLSVAAAGAVALYEAARQRGGGRKAS
ncbi:MAG TPA: 23S rRNA (guanosine(2251)-2'-O)-methyltransferase RlmB [Myxococcales bacterium]|nr:23S rRNA (guanosine(2251)-2'-O)-methyltransferase RlmB [Myxococcales bacterium]